MVKLFLIVGLLSQPVFADDIGVLVVKGDVRAGPAGQLQPVKVGSRVADGMNVKTGADALVILRYADESRVKLKEKTEIVVHAGKAKEPKGLDIILGAVFALVAKHPHQAFQVKTPVAVSGVRGTQFFTSYEGKNSAWMCVQEGQVEITENEHPTPLLVNAGFGVVVEQGKAIAAPQQYAWSKELNWNMDPAQGDLVDKTKITDEYKKKLLKNDYD